MVFFKIPPPTNELDFFGSKSISEEVPNRIKVLVWNVYKFKKKSFKTEFIENFKDCDLFFLQEITSDQAMKNFLCFQDSLYWSFAKSFQFRHNSQETGVSLGSKLPIDNLSLVRGSERELFYWTPKVSLIGEIKSKNTLLINTHVVNFTTTQRFRLFMEHLVDRLTHHHGPIILAGDFNTWNLGRWTQLLELLEKYNITHHHFEKDPRFLKLDHLFFRGFRVVRAEILNNLKGSDHFPMLFELEYI